MSRKWHDAKTEAPPRANLYLVCGTYMPTKTSGMMTCRWNGEKWDASIQIRVTDWMELPPPPRRGFEIYPGSSPCRSCRKKTDLHHSLQHEKRLGQIPAEERKTQA